MKFQPVFADNPKFEPSSDSEHAERNEPLTCRPAV